MGKKDDSIELSPKYGLNPTLPVCFFCGKETGEILLLGRVRELDSRGKKIRNSDVEVPKKMVVSYEPCDECKKGLLKEGIAIVEVVNKDETDYAPIVDGFSPTGRITVLKESGFDNLISDDDIKDAAKKKRVVLMHNRDYNVIFKEGVNVR